MKASPESSTIVRKCGFSVKEICQHYGLSKGFVMKQIREGKLGARRLGRRLIVLDEDLRMYLERARIGA